MAQRNARGKGTANAGRTRQGGNRSRQGARSNGVRPVTYGASRSRGGASGRSGRGTHASSGTRTFGPFIIIVVVAAVLIAGFGIRWLVGQAGSGGIDGAGGDGFSFYESPYDWSCMERQNGRWSYVEDGVVKSRQGIDVSEAQGDIDWQQVAADGIDFAIIRVGYRGTTEGLIYPDACFAANDAGARDAGVDVGVYFFSQAITEDEARAEAEFVLSQLGGMPLDYPVAFDSEPVSGSRTAGLSHEEMTAVAEAFCERIEQAGYEAAVYGNANDLGRLKRAFLEQHPLWWAEYGTPIPTARIDIALWQYSNEGQVAGIATHVDMNIDLRACAG